MISSYKVEKLVGLSYWLDLPTSMRIHDLFHPNLLQPVATNPLPGQHNESEPPVVINGEEEWELDNILDAKHGKGKKLLFQVKWKGYDKDKQWYPASDFDHAKEVVNDFYKRHPSKPRWVIKQAVEQAVDGAVKKKLNEKLKKGIRGDVKTRWQANCICDQVTTSLKEGVVSQIYIPPIRYLIRSR